MPLPTPDRGAEILELKAVGYDGDVTNNMGVSLYRNAATSVLIATVTTSGSPGITTISTTTVATGLEIIDNENYTYMIRANGADADPLINSVMVRYRLGVSTG